MNDHTVSVLTKMEMWARERGVAFPIPVILQSAFFKQEEDFETVDLSQQPPSTPPLVLREDLYDLQYITQEEFLAATDRRIQREYDEYFALIDDPWRDIEA